MMSGFAEKFYTFAIMIERPSAESLRRYSYAKKHFMLKENSRQKREEIATWLENHDLDAEVHSLDEGTAFNILVIEATENVSRRLLEVPGVVKVYLIGNGDIDTDLTLPHDDASNSASVQRF